MHKHYTPWSIAERAQLVGAFEGLQKRYPGFSARQFGQTTTNAKPTSRKGRR